MITLHRTSRAPLPRLVIQRQERTAITVFLPNLIGDLLTVLLFAILGGWQSAVRSVRWQVCCFKAGLYVVAGWYAGPWFRVVGL